MKVVVYSIRNKVNSKVYYGVSQEPIKRIRTHKNMLRKSSHPNLLLQEEWDDFGEHNFAFEILYTFDNREEAEEAEISLINSTRNVYNIVKDSSVGGDVFSHNPRKEEIRRKRKEQMTGKGNHQYGKPKTNKMIEAVKKANSKPVSIEGVIYPSISEAAKSKGMSKSTIGYRARSKSEKFREWKYI